MTQSPSTIYSFEQLQTIIPKCDFFHSQNRQPQHKLIHHTTVTDYGARICAATVSRRCGTFRYAALAEDHPSAARSPVKQRCISANAPKKARFAYELADVHQSDGG